MADSTDSIFQLFATDTNAEKTGKWVSIGKSQFLLARAGGSNTRFSNAYAQAMKPYQRQQQIGKFTEEQAREVMSGPFAEFVLLGWRTAVKDEATGTVIYVQTITGRDGSDMPYTKAAAKQLLLDIPDLFSLLMETAGNIATFTPEDIEASGKNS